MINRSLNLVFSGLLGFVLLGDLVLANTVRRPAANHVEVGPIDKNQLNWTEQNSVVPTEWDEPEAKPKSIPPIAKSSVIPLQRKKEAVIGNSNSSARHLLGPANGHVSKRLTSPKANVTSQANSKSRVISSSQSQQTANSSLSSRMINKSKKTAIPIVTIADSGQRSEEHSDFSSKDPLETQDDFALEPLDFGSPQSPTNDDQGLLAKPIGPKVEDFEPLGEGYRFAGADKRDPFVAPFVEEFVAPIEAIKDPNAEEIPIVSPLQLHEVKSLVVTGVWETDSNLWKAMIETPGNQAIIAKVQDPIGNSGGRIVSIDTTGLRLREYRLRKDGTQEFFDKHLQLRQADGSIGDVFKGGKIILKPGATSPEMIDYSKSDDVLIQPDINTNSPQDVTIPASVEVPGRTNSSPTSNDLEKVQIEKASEIKQVPQSGGATP